jgi:hypothetical protein
LIDLVAGVDGILQAQAAADTKYFLSMGARAFDAAQRERVGATMLRAYRWQYIVSGVQHPRFAELLTGMTTEAQMQRIVTALTPILQ